MYKTVRHGENSLQYTILPQNDDFRIEGKLSSAGSNCNSTNGRKSKARRPKRRSFFAYLGLIFVCTVIVGAVLIPFLVSAECLPNPTEWFLKTKSALTHGGNINGLHRNVGGLHEGSRKSLEHNGIPHLALHNSAAASIGQKVQIINRDGDERIILHKTQTPQLKSNETRDKPRAYESDKEEQPPEAANRVNEPQASLDAKTSKELSQPEIGIRADVRSGAFATSPPVPIDTNADAQVAVNSVAPQQPSNDANNYVTEVRFESGVLQASPGLTPSIVVTTARTQPAQAAQAAQPSLIANRINNNDNAVLNSNKLQTRPIQNGPSIAIRPTTSFSTTSIYSPHAPAGASASNSAIYLTNTYSNQNFTAPAIPTITTRIMQLPLLKSTAKKPIVPPVLVRTNPEIISPEQSSNNNLGSDATNGNSEVADVGADSRVRSDDDGPIKMDSADIVERKNADWIQSHWPYIDPSTYFQWTSYKEDSVLLPALLGFALTGMILIIAICLVARNKRAIVTSVRKRNRNDIEGGGADDNTTLLTNANLSDED